MVGFCTTEATIKIKHFRRGAHSNGKRDVWAAMADGRTSASWGEGKKNCKNLTLDVLNRGSRFATIRIARGSQRFQITWFESQGRKPLESLLRLYYSFTVKIGFTSLAIQFASVETFFARTALSQRNIQILAKNCAKLVHAHSRNPPPQYSARLCRCTPAQISHNLGTCLDAPRTSFAQIFWDLSGMPRAQVLHIFLRHMACSQNLPLYRL